MHSLSQPRHDLVVIGASAGGVEALRRVISGLPADLPATVCVVLHISPGSPSALARILERSGPLPCRTAVDGESLRPGEILVAPPDRHLMVEDGHVRLTVGPRENGHRPAVDVLFRSAAQARDGHVIGVILSGTRDDGSAGLAVIKAKGGATVVQDPDEAVYPGMPLNAIAHVAVDAVVPSYLVAQTVAGMVSGPSARSAGESPARQAFTGGQAVDPLAQVNSEQDRVSGERTPTDPDEPLVIEQAPATICPDCGGILTERHEAGVPY